MTTQRTATPIHTVTPVLSATPIHTVTPVLSATPIRAVHPKHTLSSQVILSQS
ncbi:MAG: hypothetical protein HXK31_03770 [Atopobium sp.]|nr:hypothetical protein [Atopobium sp.]